METMEQRIEKFKELNSLREKEPNLWKKKGFQVVLCANNAQHCLPATISSIELSMKGLDWVFLMADDGSTDETYRSMESLEILSSARIYRVEKFEKNVNVSFAKNRLLAISKEYASDYPGILFHDADDYMKEDRAEGLYDTALKHNSNLVVGNWLYANRYYKKREVKNAEQSIEKMSFGPWNTLFHSSLIPEDGRFWNENLMAHADLLMWWELKAAGVEFTTSDTLTTQYNSSFGTTARPTRVDVKQMNWKKFEAEKNNIIKYAGLEREEV